MSYGPPRYPEGFEPPPVPDGAAPPGDTTTDAPDDLCALAAEAIHVLRYGKPSEGLLTAADCDLASAALDAVWPVITAGAAAEARRKWADALLRHIAYVTTSDSVKCAGCGRDHPCPDAALLEGDT